MVVPGPLARAWRWFVGARAVPIEEYLDEDAGIAVHVARHEAAARGQAMSPLHVAYGLLQDEEFVAAIARAGGDAAAIEDQVLRELESEASSNADELLQILSTTVAIAHHHGRRASRADLWHRLAPTAAARPFTAGGVDARALLFVLAHGRTEPALPSNTTREVDVLFRNDDFTTMELVVALLHDVFELPRDKAIATMRAVHEHGSAVVGRYPSQIGRDRVRTARARATEQGAPLWIELANL